ncbi:uncharacterized protein LOC117652413 [Thrips palmi]|uniref:Uncharacterized protein LOC117652413 n=1 Tax=Thrips palmi TaxID=161013 RepID=A0A6P9AAW8_THRPL|nr:uncharacterized protein LOC117652413 [Thrips palmi]
MASVDLWQKLFREGKYSACSAALRKKQEKILLKEDANDSGRHALVLAIENNLFVCDQLRQDWESGTEETVSRNWAKSYREIIDLHSRVRCQHVCSKLPLDLVLSVTCNVMWWGAMKVDPCDQQSYQREIINAAIYSLNTVRKSFGGRKPTVRSYEPIETYFIDAVKDVISCLPKLTSTQTQLFLEIVCLGILSFLDNYETLQDKDAEFQEMILSLIDILPQVKLHLSYEITNSSNFEILLKFGWKEIAEFLSETSFTTISETLLSTVAVFCLRCNSDMLNENSSKALQYLNLIDRNSLVLPFIHHYLHALANFNIGNPDASLYHLQRALMSGTSFLMQARSKTLEGQILLSQEKASVALEILQSVQYKHKEVQLPLCAFLIASAYQKLGKFKHQIDVLNLLFDCLTAKQAVKPKLVSPLAGIQQRLLLSVHHQPEISAEYVLQTIAMAHFSAEQPKEAAENFWNLSCTEDSSVRKLLELLHDATCALLEAHCIDDAERLCEAALQFHSTRLDLVESTRCDLSVLSEDVIALMLLGEVKDLQKSSDVSEILNRCARLLQGLVDKLNKSKETCNKTLSMARALLARVFLHKALLNASRKFDDDSIACFQRALTWNDGDTEIILYFARFLLDRDQHEESLALWRMFKDAKQSFKIPSSVTLNHLLGDKMTRDDREEIMCRLGSLETM